MAKRTARLSQPRYDLAIEKDLAIPVRDGARLAADLFRPKSGGRFPVIVNIGAYQKDKLWVPPADLEEAPNPYMNWETVNPLWWVPRGTPRPRRHPRHRQVAGRTDPFSPSEARDFYDVIEWAARQPWCNGRVGLSGISYFAMTQWLVASLRPPSLAAMIPWEGAADMYRDFGYHGGIFSFGFVVNWYNNHMAHHLLGRPQATAPDSFATPWVWEYMRHSLDSDWYHGAGRSGRTSTARSTARATGAGWGCTCAATPRVTSAAASGTRSSASTPAPTTTASTRRRAGTTSSASSITG